MFNGFVLAWLIIIICVCAQADNYSRFNSDGTDYKHFNDTDAADDKFKDWNKVLSLLVAQGIQTDIVNWDIVESNCAHVKTYPATSRYNQCKYNNIVENYHKYQKDKTYCDAIAEQAYFDYIKSVNNGSVINNYRDNYSAGNKKPGLDPAAEKKFKDSANILCMHNLGWQ